MPLNILRPEINSHLTPPPLLSSLTIYIFEYCKRSISLWCVYCIVINKINNYFNVPTFKLKFDFVGLYILVRHYNDVPILISHAKINDIDKIIISKYLSAVVNLYRYIFSKNKNGPSFFDLIQPYHFSRNPRKYLLQKPGSGLTKNLSRIDRQSKNVTLYHLQSKVLLPYIHLLI